MKKRIICFLSFLMVAMFLTGCSERTVRVETIEEMTEMANSVINQKEYTLPNGYKVYYPNGTTDQISIRTTTNGNHIEAVYDVSEKQAKLIEIITASAIVTIVIAVICIFLIGVGIAYGTYVVIKALTKSKKE